MRNIILSPLLLVVTTSTASAQGPVRDLPSGSQRAATVTIILKEGFERRGLAAVVRRTPGAVERDIVALKRSALTPELLSAALSGLSWLRKTGGDNPPRKVELYFGSGTALPPTHDDPAWLKQTIAALLAATPRAVDGIGQVPAITVAMPKPGRPRRQVSGGVAR